MGSGLLPPTLYGQEITPGTASPQTLLVKARQGDTPASLAQRYLNDASKEWMIVEYNGMTAFSGGEAVMVPVAPFRIGGLTPDGYQSVPVLAYSDFGASLQPAAQVSQTAFKRHVHWFKTEGFKSITPSQLVDFMKFSGQLPHQSVLITVDTESQAFYKLGVPVLKALGLTATVFVATALVGSEGAMNWDQIRQLHEDGFTIACRGHSGRSLTHRTRGQTFESYFNSVASELQVARKAIQTHLNTPCLFLAYPQGDTNELVSAMAAKLGFSAAFIRSPGENPFFADRFGIHRSLINSRMSLEDISKNLTIRIKADLN
jgi:peptidoglycan/xylan/chitin deacetylase (PgdA/CDA1 family)